MHCLLNFLLRLLSILGHRSPHFRFCNWKTNGVAVGLGAGSGSGTGVGVAPGGVGDGVGVAVGVGDGVALS
jgi:hypothetical protein